MRFNSRKTGMLAIVLGGAVLLAALLPSRLWPILAGAALIAVGVCMLKC
ncbi:MAG: hypothetical protein ILP09_05735 [Oscillospiraceae bacterium]|nr:hypothetical protein [Oscillospiraceae bacterium]